MELIVALFSFAFGAYMCIRGYEIVMKSWQTIVKIAKLVK